MTAVAPVVIENNGLWIGWTGLHDYNENIDRQVRKVSFLNHVNILTRVNSF